MKRNFPNTYVIIFALVVISAIVTWFVPGGCYVKGEDGSLGFERVASVPQTWQVFTAFFNGFVKQAEIIVFILIVGGAFQVLNSTGAVDAGIKSFMHSFGGHDKLVLASIAVLFSAGGAIFGMSEETIPFVGIAVPLAISMGYDAVVGFLIVYVASNVGFSSAFLNPFTVGIAQQMSGLPLFSGMGYRIACWVFLTALTVVFILWYASKHKKEPAEVIAADTASGINAKQKAVLIILAATILMLVIGVTCFDWYIAEISALFLIMGILCGIVGGFGANGTVNQFLAGAKDIMSAALVVALASGMVIILQDGKVMDSILHGLQSGLDGSGKMPALSLMYATQAVINFFIPSATAKAAITIPVMAPFSDMIGLSRQAMVMAFQFGDGFTNMITPTSGVLVAALAMAKIPYEKWIKLAWKPVLALLILGFILLIPTVLFPLAGF
ncbi:MAG: Na+/H+ antiporter NhaC family protein [Bacteroidia bacterium]|nr:Na+/H+ antiporter NhaC family protein [Bacteroidia bacterium]